MKKHEQGWITWSLGDWEIVGAELGLGLRTIVEEGISVFDRFLGRVSFLVLDLMRCHARDGISGRVFCVYQTSTGE
jgi:hypothetical protein